MWLQSGVNLTKVYLNASGSDIRKKPYSGCAGKATRGRIVRAHGTEPCKVVDGLRLSSLDHRLYIVRLSSKGIKLCSRSKSRSFHAVFRQVEYPQPVHPKLLVQDLFCLHSPLLAALGTTACRDLKQIHALYRRTSSSRIKRLESDSVLERRLLKPLSSLPVSS